MKQVFNRGLVLLAVLVTHRLVATPIDLTRTENKVEFLALVSPGAIKIRGKLAEKKASSGSLQLTGTLLSGTVKVQLDAFDTGISMRDRHMKEKYLETVKHPTTVLTLKPLTLSGNPLEKGYTFAGDFAATLLLHGIEKPISGKLNLSQSETKWQGDFTFSVDLEEFAIEIPSYMGVKVSKTIQIVAAFKE